MPNRSIILMAWNGEAARHSVFLLARTVHATQKPKAVVRPGRQRTELQSYAAKQETTPRPKKPTVLSSNFGSPVEPDVRLYRHTCRSPENGAGSGALETISTGANLSSVTSMKWWAEANTCLASASPS